MKTRLAVLIVLCLAGCEKKEAEVVPVAPTPASAISTPAPIAVSAPAPATPSDLAPEGVFFLVEKVSVETADSILGFKPGQKLTKISDGVYSADGAELKLLDNQVTNSLSRARALISRDAAAQATLAKMRSHPSTPVPGVASQAPAPAPAKASLPVTSLDATSVHDKVQMHYDPLKHKWVTDHVN